MASVVQRRNALARGVVAAVAIFSLAACTAKKDDVETVGGGTVIGALGGAVIGGITGGSKGARRGAVIGAVVGTAAGVVVLREKQRYRNDAQMIEEETRIIFEERRSLKRHNDRLASQLSAIDRDIERLRARSDAATAERTAIKKRLTRLEASAKKRLRKAEAELVTTQKLRQSADSGQNTSNWQAEEAKLQTEKRQLERLLKGIVARGDAL